MDKEESWRFILGVVAIATAVLLYKVYGYANAIGVNFDTLATSIGYSIVSIIAAGALLFFLKRYWVSIFFLLLGVLLVSWISVLNEMANNMPAFKEHYGLMLESSNQSQVWYATWYLQYGVLLTLAILAAAFWYKKYNEY